MAATAEVNTVAYHQFTVFDECDLDLPKTGIAGTITAEVFFNDVASALSVAITETGTSGVYVAAFTPDAVGFYMIRLTVASTSDVFECHFVSVSSLFSNDGAVVATGVVC